MLPLRDEPACVRRHRLTAGLFFLGALMMAIAALSSGRHVFFVGAGCNVVAWGCSVVAANRAAAEAQRSEAGSTQS